MATNTKAEVSTTTVRDGAAPNKNVHAATELQATVMEESGDDQSNTITLVTPRRDYVYPSTVATDSSKFARPVQETSLHTSAELV